MSKEDITKFSNEELDRQLYSTLWLREAEKLDLTLFTDEEQLLLIKCREQLPVSDDELISLRKILNNYKKLDQKIHFSDAEENIKKTKDLISTEQLLLDLTEQPQFVPLVKKYKHKGEIVEIRMLVNSVADSRSVYDMISHTKLFNKMTTEEKNILNKNNVEQLNEKEKNMLKKVNSKIENMLTETENFMFIVDNTLARQVDFEDKSLSTDYDEKMKFWAKVDEKIKIDIYNSVQAIVQNVDIKPFRE